MASTYLTKSFASSGNRKKFTFSMWVKRGNIGNSFCIFNQHYSSNDNNSYIGFNSDDTLSFWSYSGSYQMNLKTSAKYRDTNGWYHIVCVADTAQATSSNRAKLYVNGVEPTLGTATYPSQNQDLNYNSDQTQQIGVYRYGSTNNYFYDGCLSHFHFTDGYAYAASDFGETDNTTGEWKIKTSPSVSYGTNGYWILKDGNSVTDQSPNTNNWNVQAGTLTKTEDNPSNVFATLNPLASLPNTAVSTFSNGNTTSQGTNASYVNGGSSLMMSSGKFYAEMKYVATSNASRCWVGITEDVSEISRINQDAGSYNVIYRSQTGGLNIEGAGENSYGATFTTGDIIGIALDLDNNRLFFSKNGTWQNSGDPTSSTGAITTFTAPASTLSGGWFFASGSDSNAQNNTVSWNFGNGYFGTTAVASAGTNASNLGIFEYDVPSGYTALCTKGLNE